MFDNSKWIWAVEKPEADEYAEFRTDFEYSDGMKLYISADSNYAVFINGKLTGFGQYADFEHWKIADEIDISAACSKDINKLTIVVWYYGVDTTSVYKKGKAGVIFELCDKDGNVVVSSGKDTESRISKTYKSHYNKVITGQLGCSFLYDSTKEDDRITEEADGFGESVEVEKPMPIMLRPIKKLELKDPEPFEIIKNDEDTRILIDMKKEVCGFIDIDVESECEQTLLIAYGEHIADGCVRRLVGGRDFSVEIKVKSGRTVYMNPFRRLSARYLEVYAEKPIKIKTVTVRPTDYPVSEKPFKTGNELWDKIYEICVNTLKLCMHEHYEDCPWREQALYAMDSRNQMLCGYYAFGEYDFARSSLQLMSKDTRKDDLLPITTPCGVDLTIPSFSMHYFTEVREYYEYSKDLTLLEEVWGKLSSVFEAFVSNMKDGFCRTFAGNGYWNFYEWSAHLSGNGFSDTERIPDLVCNCLFVIMAENMAKIAEYLGKPNERYSDIAATVRENINKMFYDREKGVYIMRTDGPHITELGNSLAILCGATDKEKAENIAAKLADKDSGLVGISLSMACFKYDALLKADREKYKDYVLGTIEEIYKKMLDEGSTTVWETTVGQSDFGNAGSLCHGWSAMPVYYYHTLLGEE